MRNAPNGLINKVLLGTRALNSHGCQAGPGRPSKGGWRQEASPARPPACSSGPPPLAHRRILPPTVGFSPRPSDSLAPIGATRNKERLEPLRMALQRLLAALLTPPISTGGPIHAAAHACAESSAGPPPSPHTRDMLLILAAPSGPLWTRPSSVY